MERIVGTGDQRGDLCPMCRMSAQVHGYECLGDMGREGLGTIWGSCWGSCERAMQPPQPRCLSRTHPTTLHTVSTARPRQAHLTHPHSPPDPACKLAFAQQPSPPAPRAQSLGTSHISYKPHRGEFIHPCKPAPEPPPDQTCHNKTA